MNINVNRKEIVKFILKVYLPMFILLNIVGLFIRKFSIEFSFVGIFSYFIFPLFFCYPIYLLVEFKFKKFFHWLFIGVIPLVVIIYISTINNSDFNFDTIYYSIIFSNIMYPLGLLGIKTFKDYWEMSKEMTLFGKIGLFLSLLFIIISIIKRSRW